MRSSAPLLAAVLLLGVPELAAADPSDQVRIGYARALGWSLALGGELPETCSFEGAPVAPRAPAYRSTYVHVQRFEPRRCPEPPPFDEPASLYDFD